MKKLAILSLITVMALTPSLDLQAQSRSTKTKSEGQLKRDLSKIRQEKAEIRRELKTTQKAVRVVAEDIEEVDQRIDRVEGELEETSYQLGRSRIEQKKVTEELEAATENMAKSKEQVRGRLKSIYMRGSSSPISVFVGTKDAGEVASRAYLMQAIAKKDRETFDEYTRLQELVTAKKKRADELVEEISRLAAFHRSKRNELKDARDEKGQYLGKLKEKEGDLKQALAQFAADERRIESQIAAFSRRTSSKLPPFVGKFSPPMNSSITSGFGSRFHPILKIRRLHAGVDFRGKTGDTIRAAADGEVIAAETMRGYGKVVIIAHGSGYSTVYAHCSRIDVRAGQRVTRGQAIAAVGSTGLATGPHLHFELRLNGKPINPVGR